MTQDRHHPAGRPDPGTATYLRSLPEHAHLLSTSVFEARWGDMDAFGHVNNASYFNYFQQARVDWLHSLGAEHALVLANISCTFLKPLICPVTLEVRLYGGVPGRSSLNTYYEIRKLPQADPLCAIGHGTIVWYDHAAGRPMKIPPAIRRTLEDRGP
jgi:acyl-CoA thioester hydrolase